jgi:hypothetical protein
MPRRLLISLVLALTPAIAAAQTACPDDVAAQLHGLTEAASVGKVSLGDLSEAATRFATACGEDRAVLGQILAMFTAAGIGIEPPDPERFQAHVFAYRTVNRIRRGGDDAIAPVAFTGPDGAALSWGPLDERNAYWDLMFAISSDYLIYGVHTDFYTPGKIEAIGCGLYPDEEAAALARQAEGNLDGGELVARVAYLGRACNGEEHETSGYAAQYFAEHARARAADPAYAGLTESDIRAGLSRFLESHLNGADESWLFDAGAVAELRAF